MLIKSLSRKSNGSQLIKYIFRYIFNEEKVNANSLAEKIPKSKFIIQHNVRGHTLNNFIKQFERAEDFRIVKRKDNVRIYHTVVSFSSKDTKHIDDSLLKDIAQKFISERSPNALVIGTKHEDKNHVHLHLAISAVKTDGFSSRISKKRLHNIKCELNRYQQEKYPALVNSLPKHGRSKEATTKEQIGEAAKQSRQTQKALLCGVLEETYKGSKSLDHFLSKLKSKGHEPYYRNRNGELQGIVYAGIKYRLERLGYGEKTLQALEKVQEEKELAGLQSLRIGSSRERNASIRMDVDIDNPTQLEQEEQETLAELSSLRTDGPDRGKGREDEEERDKDTEAEMENDPDEENPSR